MNGRGFPLSSGFSLTSTQVILVHIPSDSPVRIPLDIYVAPDANI